MTNFKIHFLSNIKDFRTDMIPMKKSPSGRNVILDMPLGFVSKVKPVVNGLDLIGIKVDCKDMRYFTLIMDEVKNFTLPSILDLKISNPFIILLVDWISSKYDNLRILPNSLRISKVESS